MLNYVVNIIETLYYYTKLFYKIKAIFKQYYILKNVILRHFYGLRFYDPDFRHLCYRRRVDRFFLKHELLI